MPRGRSWRKADIHQKPTGAANSRSRRLSMALLTILRMKRKPRSGNQGRLSLICCREDGKNFHALTRGAG
jgi:hypothetical protein